jgi:FHS family L-fucose permease-like MFS transporter
MAIIGGAVFPALMGYISDVSTIRYAFLVPLICHTYVLYFALSGYRPVAVLQTLGSTNAVPAD